MVHFIWPVMTEMLFSLPLNKDDTNFGHVRMYATPDNINTRFGAKLNKQIVGVPMGTKCTALVKILMFSTHSMKYIWYSP